jgi:hypothetical protein
MGCVAPGGGGEKLLTSAQLKQSGQYTTVA